MAQKLLTRKQRRRRRVLIILSVLFGLGVVSFFTYGSIFHIQGVEVLGAKHTDIISLENDIQPWIHEYRYWIIPNNNIFIYQKKKIEDFILQTYPSVETVDMHIDTHRKLIIRIKDRKPLGVWCIGECYLYDTAGVLFKKSFTYTGALFVSWKKDDDTVTGLLDTVSCSELCTDVKFLDFLRVYKIEKAVLHDNMVELISTDGYYIKAGLTASTTMAHMRDVVESKPDILQNLEYIDVRFDNKLFYKERG